MKKKKYLKAVRDTTTLHARLVAGWKRTVRPSLRKICPVRGKRLAVALFKTSSLKTCQMLVLLCLKYRMGKLPVLVKNSESQRSSHASVKKRRSSKNH